MVCQKIVLIQLVTLVLLSCSITNGLAIKCWVCRSDFDPNCGDPFKNTTAPITDCSQFNDLEHLPGVRPTMCRKIRQRVSGEWRIFRSCAYLGEPGILGDESLCLMRTGTHNIFMEYCTCNSDDGCNSATGLYHDPYRPISLTVLVFAWFRLRN
ncbi:uncharacterized protein LOC106648878 [Trichogramma pretiosum]|uniref:uncharacterized protein LOC106648878 n=1 Tax=Trichogramma pretiosum TaxID=7493 RepID=UPI000C718A81|nr:uncharacterized protein LOC106648878 [Trichogramma pretiosum]